MIFLVFTNDFHHLVWSGFLPAANDYIYLRGPLYWLGVIYDYFALVIMTIFLVKTAFKSRFDIYRTQSLLTLFGILPPWLANFVYLVWNKEMQGLDLTPIAFSITGFFLYLGVTRYRLFDLTPVARDILFEQITDGIIVLDNSERIVDINVTGAEQIGKTQQEIIGKSIREVLSPFQKLIQKIEEKTGFYLEICDSRFDQRTYDAKGILIKTGDEQVQGQFIAMRDITAKKRSEEMERKQHQFNEAMRNIAMTLTSTLNLDEVLDRILDSVSVVIPCTMINIMLVDEQHIAHVARFKGYLTAELIQLVTTVAFDVDNIPNLHLMENTGQPFIVPDILKVDYWQVTHSELRAYLGAPIQLKGRLFGFINLDHNHPDYFTEDDAANLKVFADLAAIAIENAHLFAKMNEMAEMDELTKISNRRHFFALADKEVRRSIRYGNRAVLVMMDIDCFKEINDTWGHQVGDTVLEKVAEIFRTSIREMDIAGRYGGDEFCILLPNAGEDDAVHFVERMTHQINKIKIPGVRLAKKISISCGVAALTPADASLDDLLRKADLALYAAKLNGRDRIEKYNPA